MAAQLSGLCISSTSGGGGKTLLSLGLGRLTRQKGITVKPFKKGPDYIDAAWLTAACGRPATNLDPFFMDSDSLRTFFTQSLLESGAEFALLEGNRGLYDGLDERGSCSTAALARLLGFPILLSIDCAKSTRTIAAILKGVTEFEDNLVFAGVIFNNIGSIRHEQALCKAVKNYSPLKILGCIPRIQPNPIPERHMGLSASGAPFSDRDHKILDKLARIVSEHCDFPGILQSARMRLETPEKFAAKPKVQEISSADSEIVIGYARDEAFWFYYPENLKALKQNGARLKPLSLTNYNARDWKNISGLYIGGGFPEDFCQKLSRSPGLPKIRELAENGLPIYAECGGLMLLCRQVVKNNETWPMAGIFNLDVHWHSRPQGLGYVQARVIAENPYFQKGVELKGHEFHYSSCHPCGPAPPFQVELRRGAGILNKRDGLMFKNVWASYLHIFAPATPGWAPNFIKLAENFRAEEVVIP